MTNITDSGVDSVPSISTFLVLESHGTNHILVSFDHSNYFWVTVKRVCKQISITNCKLNKKIRRKKTERKKPS